MNIKLFKSSLSISLSANPEFTARALIPEAGRSMIEMLGVLAIIGVLSVGGIAGYSKAMEMYKMNKVIDEYSSVFFELQKFRINRKDTNGIDYVLAKNTGVLPAGWSVWGGSLATDNNGYVSQISQYADDPQFLYMYLLLGNKNDTPIMQAKYCQNLVQKFVQPLHDTVYVAGLSNQSHSQELVFYGDKYCDSNKPCLSNLSISTIVEECNKCLKQTSDHCYLNVIW